MIPLQSFVLKLFQFLRSACLQLRPLEDPQKRRLIGALTGC